MDHQALKELLALAALDGLGPAEQDALDAHLRDGCAECRVELREFREAITAFALANDQPDDELVGQRIWNRLAARLDAASSVAKPPAGPRAPQQWGRRSAAKGSLARSPAVRWRIATGASVAATLAVAIYAGVVAHTGGVLHEQLAALSDQLSASRADLQAAHERTQFLEKDAAERARLEGILMASDAQFVRLRPPGPGSGASALLVLSENARAAMIQTANLPLTPDGKTYELWWITKERGPVAAGVFQALSRQVIAPAELPPAGDHVELCAVTLEPTGGVNRPTGAMYLKGTVARQ